MESQNNIIERIMTDANDKAKQIIANAEKLAESTISEAELAVFAQRKELDERILTNKNEIQKNAMSNAELEIRKYRLLKKQQLVNDCYAEALLRLIKLGEKDYLALITKLLKTYAENGEEVCIAKKDAKLITQQFLDGYKLNLKLSKNFADISGGVILSGNGYDKDLSLEVVVNSIRESTEINVAKIMFDGE